MPEIRPIFIRLPENGERCPYTGYSRTGLYNVVVPCKANKFRPPVPAKCDRKPGNLRGTWMIPFEALIAYIENLPTPDLAPAEDVSPSRGFGEQREDGQRGGVRKGASASADQSPSPSRPAARPDDIVTKGVRPNNCGHGTGSNLRGRRGVPRSSSAQTT